MRCVACLLLFFLAIVDGAEIVIDVTFWGSSLAVSSCADIFEGSLWQCSLREMMVGAVNNPCEFVAVCSCHIVFISAQICCQSHSSLCYTDVGVRFSVFLYGLSGDIPWFSQLLIQMLPECLKLVIPAATVFTACRPSHICYLTTSDQ